MVHESGGKRLAHFGGDIILTQFHFHKLIAGPLITAETRSFAVFAICVINKEDKYLLCNPYLAQYKIITNFFISFFDIHKFKELKKSMILKIFCLDRFHQFCLDIQSYSTLYFFFFIFWKLHIV